MSNYNFTEEELWEIVERKHSAAAVIEDRVVSKGFYEVHEIDFGFKGVMYTFTYRKHKSEHIDDKDIITMPEISDNQPHTINTEEETHFIWQGLMKEGISHITKEEIDMVTDLQYQYLISIGLVE